MIYAQLKLCEDMIRRQSDRALRLELLHRITREDWVVVLALYLAYIREVGLSALILPTDLV